MKTRRSRAEAPAGSAPLSRLRASDVLAVGSSGLRTRKLRAALSALGISIGIAAMVAVLGLSESSRADLNAEIEALGTNLLTVTPGEGFGAGDGALPEGSAEAAARIAPVEEASAVIPVEDSVLRNDVMDPTQTGGLSVVGADGDLLDTLNGSVADGVWLDGATGAYPNAVLGSVSAERLGIEEAGDGVQVWVGDEWFTVIGILDPFPLAADLDRAVIIGEEAAVEILEAEANPEAIYIRTDPDQIDDVRAVLPSTVDPESPEEVSVSRPSDVLEAQAGTMKSGSTTG